MKTLTEKINDIFEIVNSEKKIYSKNIALAEYIIDLEQKEFNRGLGKGTEMTKKVFTNSK